jgi:hypothetical protein
MSDLKQAFQSQLIAAGVPVNQATAAAEALAVKAQVNFPFPYLQTVQNKPPSPALGIG